MENSIDRAYEALRDAEFTLELLEQCEDDNRRFRILFVACMTLLSTVGQVLARENGNVDIKKAVKEIFDEHKTNEEKHDIYFKFIKQERGMIIHEYDVNLPERDTALVMKQGNEAYLFEPGDLYKPLADDNYWGNEDVRDLIQQAIDWWKNQLQIIEDKLV